MTSALYLYGGASFIHWTKEQQGTTGFILISNLAHLMLRTQIDRSTEPLSAYQHVLLGKSRQLSIHEVGFI